ncbi:hypothetical protein [Streptomyces collinus]|uniref:Uncharacterized protein n=1 Tax=Streptomyces collinus (strain DSM 40733 / Tue 365) TaxID=1214242 RepID=S5VFC3_STRC3|nr:hypothetical protein [Streptomyces collinus]AGS73919.1 hypothetical protein B446_35803 [Streptomyces collinus Tu 365]
MLIREATFTVDLGEHGYLIGFDDDYDFPHEMPFGWRCGPATDAIAVVLPTTDTGPLQMTVQVHDRPPGPEPGDGWEPAEEMSLLADVPTLYLATIGQGDFWDAWPEEQPPLEAPPPAADSGGWVRMRLYCHVDDPEPGIGDHGERHLVQLWPAPQMPPVHPDISETDRQARADYAADRAKPLEDYTATFPYPYGDETD